MAREAQELLASATTVCDALALAVAAEARAAARMGEVTAATAAVSRLERLVDRIDRPATDEAFRFTEKRCLLYLSGVLTNIGQTHRARAVQAQALALYLSEPALVIDPALIQLDQAVCAAVDGNSDDACQQAMAVLGALPREHRTSLVTVRALDVVRSIPAGQWHRPAAVALREQLTPPGRRR